MVHAEGTHLYAARAYGACCYELTTKVAADFNVSVLFGAEASAYHLQWWISSSLEGSA